MNSWLICAALASLVVLLPHETSAQCQLPERWFDAEGTDATSTEWYCGEDIRVTVSEDTIDSTMTSPTYTRECGDSSAMNGVFEVVLTEENDGGTTTTYCTQGFAYARGLLFNQVESATATTAQECADELGAEIAGGDAIWDLWTVFSTSTTGDVFNGDSISAAHQIPLGDYLLDVETSLMEVCPIDDTCSSQVTIEQQIMIVDSCLGGVSYDRPFQTRLEIDAVFTDEVVMGGSEHSGSMAIRFGLDFYCARYEYTVVDGERTDLVIEIRTDQIDNPHCYGPDAGYLDDATSWVIFTIKSLACCEGNPCNNGVCQPVLPNKFECDCAPGTFPPNCETADELCGPWSAYSACLPPGCTKVTQFCKPRRCGGCPAFQHRTRSCPPQVAKSETKDSKPCDTSGKCTWGVDLGFEFVKRGFRPGTGTRTFHRASRQCCKDYRPRRNPYPGSSRACIYRGGWN